MTKLSAIRGFGASGSSGGGGSSSSSSGAVKPSILYDEDYVGTFEAGWDEIAPYSRVHQYSPRGQFAIHSHTFNSGANSNPNPLYHNRLRIAPFTVNQSTGVMTWGTRSNGFLNTGGYVHSTQSYGFGGSYGVNWGYSAWGSNTSHYHGGCVWRIVNNAVVGGQSTGNTSYASENTSNGMLAVYEYSGSGHYNIPNGAYTSKGSINSSGNNSDWANQSETNHNGSTCIIYRCVGKTVGENHAGLLANNLGIQAMNASGGAGVVGSINSSGGGQQQSGGIGFELDSGVQVYFTNKGTYIRGTKTGGITYKATVTKYGSSDSSLPNIGSGGTDLTKVGILETNFTYNASGYAAKETDTFYWYDSNTKNMVKFKIRNPSAGNVSIELRGTIDLSDIGGTSNISHYSGLVDVTGNDDQFLVCSFRTGSYRPSSTIVVDNPIKDA